MKIKISIIIILLFTFLGRGEIQAQTAQSVLSQAAVKAQKAKGIVATFSATGSGRSMSGEIKAVGHKFHVKTGGRVAWYNGKNLWSYNPSTKECTVETPSTSTLSEINPLLYLSSYPTFFSSAFSSSKIAGKYVVDLNAKSRKAPAKKITVYLDKSTLMPSQFVVTSRDGGVVTLKINAISYNSSIPSSTFEFQKSNFKDVRVVDLR
ncbi:MAG: outer-membrane lipoprotein carrier protein LolA [Muribaculaceae bacterium]|nr:outer-membrane lipoprotein carrier protein LolA [Muribaculaceae bacterium]